MPEMPRPSDPQLMLRAKSGDTDAFELLVERHKDMVYMVCYSVLRSRQDAEEAAQDTFLKLFRKRHLYDESRALVPWLLRIAGYTSRDLARRRGSLNDRVPRLGAIFQPGSTAPSHLTSDIERITHFQPGASFTR